MELPHIFRCCLMENASRIPPVRMAVTVGDGFLPWECFSAFRSAL